MGARVLVVDRSAATRDSVADLLGDRADVAWCAPATALAHLRAQPCDVVLVDGEATARELVGTGARVVLIGDAAAALRAGAIDAVARPFVAAELILRVASPAAAALERRRPRKSDVLIGTGPWIAELYDRIAMVAATEATVAITGESGTGKELVARTIHNSSPRAGAPFVVVNCAAIPEALLEDELFGHVRGAFTDASRDREGLFSAAHTGTLFFDEIGELPLALQAKLLRVVQTHEFRRLGEDVDRKVDVRIITATHRELTELVAAGAFRQDLYYRIAVFPLRLPPLRERLADVPLLVGHFLGKYRGRLGKPIEGATPAALARLAAHAYPGNVRELENRLQQAMVVAAGPLLEEDDVAPAEAPSGRVDVSRAFKPQKQAAIAEFERAYLRELLRVHDGNLAAAARAAGMDRKNLWALMRKHELR